MTISAKAPKPKPLHRDKGIVVVTDLATRAQTAKPKDEPVYDRRALTYSNTFDSPARSLFIRTVELLTGKLRIVQRIRRFERLGEQPKGQDFWRACMNVMGITVLTPPEQLANIPKTGPVVLVANHPHGMVDGMIIADVIGRVRDDYRILTRSILTGIDESAGSYMIAVPFPHEPDAQKKMIEMRRKTMAHLAEGGIVALFPSGSVATASSMFGPAVEAEWNVFTAKMIRTSGAQVVPMYFAGHNSRWYQIAHQISATLRQGLLLHEIAHAFDKPQKPVVGPVITQDEMAPMMSEPRTLMAWLRNKTLALKEDHESKP